MTQRNRQPLRVEVQGGRRHPEARFTRHWHTTYTPGIVITPYWDGERFQSLESRPCLTHATSGKQIGGPYASIEQARAIAAALGGLAADWTGEAAAIQRFISRQLIELRLWDWFRQVRRPLLGVQYDDHGGDSI